jgi:hypothetical protein
MINSQQQKPQIPKPPIQPYVHSVYVCAVPPADSDAAALDTSPEHHPTLEPVAASSVDFRHSAAPGPGNKGRLVVQFHSQARGGIELEHQHLVLDDDGYEGATSSMLKIFCSLESQVVLLSILLSSLLLARSFSQSVSSKKNTKHSIPSPNSTAFEILANSSCG